MGWLLELLIDGLQEMLSQFVVDMMDLVTGMFTELLSCDLSLFEELFSVVGDLYKNVIVPLGVAMLLLIWIWQLFKAMFGKSGVSSEEPIELILRSCIALFFIIASKPMINYVLDFAGTPYQWVVGTEIKVESFSEYVSALEGVTGVLGIGRLNLSILMLIMQFVVAWNYFKMLFIIAERYVLLGVFAYTAPLAFSTGGSKGTNNILASWAKMFGGQIVLIILNAWCMKMFLSGYGNLTASSYGFTKFFVATLCLVGFCKITFKMDSYMASLGVNLGRPTNGLGAMGLMMAGGRILSFVGRGNSGNGTDHTTSGSSGTSTETGGNGEMSGASTGPIPMSFGADNESMNMKDMQENGGFEDPDGMNADMEMSEGFGTEDIEEPGVLDEMGVMSTVPETDEDMNMDMSGKEGVNGEAGMNLDSGDVSEDTEALREGSGMTENGFGEETTVLGDMGDYPVEEELDTEADPEMDLEGGAIDSVGMDAEDVSYGSADSSYGNGISGNGAEKVSGHEGADSISEIGGQPGVSSFDSSSAEGDSYDSNSSDGHTFDMTTPDGKPISGSTQMMDHQPEMEGAGVMDHEHLDDGYEVKPERNKENPMNNLDSGNTIPSGEGKFQRSRAGRKNFREVPRSREELKNRKRESGKTDSSDRKDRYGKGE